MKNQILYICLYFIIANIAFAQRLVTESNKFNRLKHEFNSIYNNQINEETFFYPYVEKKPSDRSVKVGYKHLFILEPTFSIRINNNGMEMYTPSYQYWDYSGEVVRSNDLVNKDMIWISPGIKIHSTIPIITNYANIWMYNWSTFYKHSAYGFDGLQSWIDKDTPLFNYSNEYSIEYYEPTESPDSGIDFDEGQSGISVLSENFQLIFGKFKTNIGPFYSGNLSISDNPPSFNQFLFKVNFNNKIHFSYLVGSLTSYVEKKYESSAYTDQWLIPSADLDLINNYISDISSPMMNRYIVNHRFDFLPTPNFRIGLYEQIIFGGDSVPFGYLIPLNPLLSSQHATNDQDNLQIGLDLEYLFTANRITFALMMDEWALYDTFKKTERNWFAYQFGYSKIGKLFNKDLLFKLEYTYVDPGAYNHRFIINEPKHHGYNLGYWSDSNSDDFIANISFFLNKKSILLFEYQYSRFYPYQGGFNKGLFLQKQYQNELGLDHLEQFVSKNKLTIIFSRFLVNSFYIDIEFSKFNNINKRYILEEGVQQDYIVNGVHHELFSSEKNDDIRIKLRYNISK